VHFSGQIAVCEISWMKSRITEKAPSRAADRLNEILGSDDLAQLLVTLREMTGEFGGVHQVAQRARLNRSQLYRTLSDRGNPEFRTLAAILRTMGLRLAVRPIQAKRPKRMLRRRPVRH
jgi:probable addiction module antidote protein